MTSPTRIPRNPERQPASGKAELRKLMLAARRALAPETRAQWDREIGAKVVHWWRASGVGALGVYWPLRDEPNLQACYAELAELGVKLLLPVGFAFLTAQGISELIKRIAALSGALELETRYDRPLQ